MAASRHPILFTQWGLVPVAIVLLSGWAVFASNPIVQIVSAAIALVTAIIAAVLWRARPSLLLDERGYAVWEGGREKLRVGWDEVKRVRCDQAEHACYVDCGEPARNLLVPPRRGYGFRFERQAELYAQVIAAVGADRLEMVKKLDQ